MEIVKLIFSAIFGMFGGGKGILVLVLTFVSVAVFGAALILIEGHLGLLKHFETGFLWFYGALVVMCASVFFFSWLFHRLLKIK